MAVAEAQFSIMLEDKGEHIACLEARKQLAWYLRGVPHSGFYKEKISHLATAAEFATVVKEMKRDLR
jgi:tRNA-dihydrouridine synthase B